MTEKEIQELREMLKEASFEEEFEAFEAMSSEDFEYFKTLPKEQKREYLKQFAKKAAPYALGGVAGGLAYAAAKHYGHHGHHHEKQHEHLMNLESKHASMKIEPGKTAIFDLKIKMQFYNGAINQISQYGSDTSSTRGENETYELNGNFNVPIFGYSALLGSYKKNPEFITNIAREIQYGLITPVGIAFYNPATEFGSNLTFLLFGNNNEQCKISILSEQVPYSQLLFLLGSREFLIKRIRYTFQENDPNGDNKNLIVSEVSMFGKTSSDSINISSFKSPDQYQKNIIDINTEIYMNADKTIWFPVNVTKLNNDEKERIYSFNMLIEKL
jgi:hypothetical protein